MPSFDVVDEPTPERLRHLVGRIATKSLKPELEQMLADAGREVTIHRYPGTGHWFAEPSRDAYDAEAAELAFDRTIDFLERTLGGA